LDANDIHLKNKYMKTRLLIFLLLLLFTGISSSFIITKEASSTPAQADLLKMEEEVWRLVNDYRVSKGLSKLEMNEYMRELCREHSQNMANGTVNFGHGGFDERTDLIWAKIAMGAIAENVAYNSSGAQQALVQWQNSSGHNTNMLGDYTITGIGIASSGGTYYFTQMFLRK
jgi:uncharacterized protein YkwD